MFPGTDDEPKARKVPEQGAIPTEVSAIAPAAATHNNPGAQIPAF